MSHLRKYRIKIGTLSFANGHGSGVGSRPENILLVHEEDPGSGLETFEGQDAWDLKIIDWGYASWSA